MSTKALLTTTAPIVLGLLLLVPGTARAQQTVGASEVGPSLVARGAQLYSYNCGRCHNMRPSSERDDGEWSVIVAHMRARGNLTRSEAEALLAFLQATNADAPSTVAIPTPSEESLARPGAPALPPDETISMLERIRAEDGR